MLAALFVRLGAGPQLAKAASAGIVVIAIVTALLWYGHSRYQAGVTVTDAKWEEASRKLEEQAKKSATKADDAAAARAAVHDDQVQAEKEKLDEAERTGSSPLDVLFGG